VRGVEIREGKILGRRRMSLCRLKRFWLGGRGFSPLGLIRRLRIIVGRIVSRGSIMGMRVSTGSRRICYRKYRRSSMSVDLVIFLFILFSSFYLNAFDF